MFFDLARRFDYHGEKAVERGTDGQETDSTGEAGRGYLLVCRTEGKTPKTLRGYREKLTRFCRRLNGNLEDFTLQAVRSHIGELQSIPRYQGHPYCHTQQQRLSGITVKGHAVVLKGFATWLYEEEYTGENILGRF